jgi:hypothetical protein
MITNIATFITRVALLAAFGSFTLSAVAAAKPTIVQGFYQEGHSFQCFTKLCTVDFTAIPAAKSLILQHVSCAIQVTSGSVLTELHVTSISNNATQSDRLNYLVPELLGTENLGAGDDTFYHVNNDVLVIVTALEIPRVWINLSAPALTLAGHCSISGQLKP